MPATTQETQKINDLLRDLEKKIVSGHFQEEDWEALKNLYRELEDLWERALSFLELAADVAQNDPELHRKIEALRRERSREIVSVFAERLRWLGRDPKVANALSSTSLYRLMELTRLGKRDQVFYALLRAYAASSNTPVEFPSELARAFKPIYSQEDFSILLLSFLAGVQQRQSQESKQDTQQTEE